MDSLSIWDYTNLIKLGYVALGPAAVRSSDDTTLRVVNDSDIYQAQDVTVEAAGDSGDQLFVSLDGANFTATLALGDLPPGAASAPFWLRRVTASTATPGLHTATLAATPGSWVTPADIPDAPANIPLETP